MVSESQPALTVYLYYAPTVDGTGPTSSWELQVEHIDHQINRTVSIIPIPAVVFTQQGDNDIFDQRPIAWVLDLGLIQETLTLRGISSNYSLDQSGPNVPTIGQLREIVRCVSIGMGSLSSIEASFNRLVEIEIFDGPGSGSAANPAVASTPVYAGVILNFSSARDGGQRTWSWSLTLGVCNWSRSLFQFQQQGYPA